MLNSSRTNAPTFRRRKPLAALVLALAFVAPIGAAFAERSDPPDPTSAPLLLTAGFLEHHQDLNCRLHGMDVYKKQNYADAMQFFRCASFYVDKPSQGMVAEM